jgi:hypothetical protein
VKFPKPGSAKKDVMAVATIPVTVHVDVAAQVTPVGIVPPLRLCIYDDPPLKVKVAGAASEVDPLLFT